MVTLNQAAAAVRDVQRAGQEVGDWHLTEVLGAGGLGVTWLAQHRWRKDGPTARAVIKFMLPPGFRGDARLQALADAQYSQIHERYADSFIVEAQTLEKLHSDFIPKILGYGRVSPTTGGHAVPWFAQEFIDGRTLDQLLRLYGPLSGGEWFDVAHDLLRAFREAHDRNIKHLDLKLDNVVVHDERAVLIDFGLAVSGFDGEWGSDGGLSGTWGWYPPEHLDGVWGTEDIAPSADIFKLGLLLYTVATGYHPMRPWGADGVQPANDSPAARLEVSKEIRSLMRKSPDLAGLTQEQLDVVKPMLAFEHARRPSARRALALVAPYLESDSWRAREVQSIIDSVPIAQPDEWTRVAVPTRFDNERPSPAVAQGNRGRSPAEEAASVPLELNVNAEVIIENSLGLNFRGQLLGWDPRRPGHVRVKHDRMRDLMGTRSYPVTAIVAGQAFRRGGKVIDAARLVGRLNPADVVGFTADQPVPRVIPQPAEKVVAPTPPAAAPRPVSPEPAAPREPRTPSFGWALVWSLFGGVLGIDRFYVGRPVLGVLKLVTAGGWFIWWLVDVLLLVSGSMRDGHGNRITVPEAGSNTDRSIAIGFLAIGFFGMLMGFTFFAFRDGQTVVSENGGSTTYYPGALPWVMATIHVTLYLLAVIATTAQARRGKRMLVPPIAAGVVALVSWWLGMSVLFATASPTLS